jgi:hypothetical protein
MLAAAAVVAAVVPGSGMREQVRHDVVPIVRLMRMITNERPASH